MLKSLRAGDWVVLLLVVLGVGSTAHYVGITNPTVIAMLSIGWTCPAARQLIAWRRGDAPMRRMSPDDLATTPVLLFGAAPWAILPLMHALNPGSALLSLALPPAARVLGAVLIVIGILSPLWTTVAQVFRPAPVAQVFGPAPVAQVFGPAPVAQVFRPAPVAQVFRPAPVAQVFRPATAKRLFDGGTSAFEAIGLLLVLGSAFFAALAFGVWATAPLARRLAARPRTEPLVTLQLQN